MGYAQDVRGECIGKGGQVGGGTLLGWDSGFSAHRRGRMCQQPLPPRRLRQHPRLLSLPVPRRFPGHTHQTGVRGYGRSSEGGGEGVKPASVARISLGRGAC